MNSIKRETSVAVTELQNVSETIKRLAISVDGQPTISHPNSAASSAVNTARYPPTPPEESGADSAGRAYSQPRGMPQGGTVNHLPPQGIREGDDSATTMQAMQADGDRKSQPILTVLSTSRDNFHMKYEVMNEIGRGGFSKVYKCRNRQTDGIYAVKV
jgi:hypothetical protein